MFKALSVLIIAAVTWVCSLLALVDAADAGTLDESWNPWNPKASSCEVKPSSHKAAVKRRARRPSSDQWVAFNADQVPESSFPTAIPKLESPKSQAAPEEVELKMLKFRAVSIAAVQSQGASLSAGLGWNPEVRLTRSWSLGIGLEWVVFQNEVDHSSFHTIAYQGVLNYRVPGAPLGIEFGAGLQTFFNSAYPDSGGTHPLVGLGLFVPFDQKPLRVLERVLVGYSGYFFPGIFTHEIRAGLGFEF